MNTKSTMEESPPKYLYRYYGNPVYILDVLAHKRLYYSLTTDFNDPFDCKPFISIRHQPCTCLDTWLHAFYYLNKIRFPELLDKDATTFAEQAIKENKHTEPDFLVTFEKDINDIGDPLRVCCFATSPRNPMMWAHYASSYEGVAFQFRTVGLGDLKTQTFRGFHVDYRQEPLDLTDYVSALRDFHENQDDRSIAKLFYCTKSHHWKKEHEVRFFSNPTKPYVEFDESTLSKIIIGEKCPKVLVDLIHTSISSWKNPPSLFSTLSEKSGIKLHISKYQN